MVSREGIAVWPDETPTPTCNILRFTVEHWFRFERDYEILAKRLGRNHQSPKRFSIDAGSVGLYSKMEKGEKDLIWYPGGVELFTELFPFFVKHSIGMMMPPRLGRFLMELRAGDSDAESSILGSRRTELRAGGDESWIVCSKQPANRPKGLALGGRQMDSGVFSRMPSAVHWAYLVALILSREQDCGADQTVCEQFESPCEFPARSRGLSDLTFVRTSTWLMEGVFVGIAYLPGVALFFDAFAADTSPPNLVTADALLL